MKFLKKARRIIILVFLIILASIGVGLAGGIPVRSSNRKEDMIEAEIIAEEENDMENDAFN